MLTVLTEPDKNLPYRALLSGAMFCKDLFDNWIVHSAPCWSVIVTTCMCIMSVTSHAAIWALQFSGSSLTVISPTLVIINKAVYSA